jgi:ketosteroid isomerase-like protein
MKWSTLLVSILFLIGCASVPQAGDAPSVASLVQAEKDFAQSMAARDFQAFGRFIDDDAIFINGGKPLRGKPAILAEWQKYFTDAQAPFNWEPVVAEVSVSHGLGYTEGPVKTADGTTIITFHTTWKHTGDGWKVVFDNGYDVCDCRQQP